MHGSTSRFELATNPPTQANPRPTSRARFRTLDFMAPATISQFRHLIRTLNYVVSTRAAEELEDDHLCILNLENIILTGQITARQRDPQSREVKCVVTGATLNGTAAEAVVKIGITGKLIVVTVYRC